MKKVLHLFLLAAMLLPMVARAQEELTVYDGTESNYYVPAYVLYWDAYTRSQFVIPAGDLQEMTGATITSLTFYTTNSDIPYTSVSEADVFLKEVDYTTISAYEDKENVVYSGYFVFESTGNGGMVTLEFSQPYVYNGGNLLIGIENTTNPEWRSIEFYGQNVSGASVASYDYGGTEYCVATQQDFLPKTTFAYIPSGAAVCYKPNNLTVSSLASNQVTVNWTGRNGESQWMLYLDGEAVGESSVENYTFGNLAPQTTYNWGVRAVCGDGDTSSLANGSFTTPCGAVSSLPHLFSIDDGLDCWNNFSGYSFYTQYDNTLGAYCFYVGYGTGYLATAPVTHAANDLWITFQMRHSSNGQLQVGVMPVGGTVGDVQWIGSTEIESGDNGVHSVEFYTSDVEPIDGDVCVVFMSNGSGYCYVSDVVVDAMPTCLKPQGLTVSGVGASSATLAWTGTAAMYRIELLNLDDSTVQTFTATGNTYTFTGLTQQTPYQVALRAVCDEGVDSSLTVLAAFNTTCPALTTLPQTWDMDAEALYMTPTCWQVLKEGPAIVNYNDGQNIIHMLQLYKGAVATTPIDWPSDSLYVQFFSSTYMQYGIMPAGGTINDVQWIGTASSGEGVKYFTTQGYQIDGPVSIVFKDVSEYSNPFIDDVEVYAYTGCTPVQSVWSSDYTESSAKVYWNSTGAATYEVMLSDRSDWENDENRQVFTATDNGEYSSNYLQLTDLAMQTYYYVRVRALCDGYNTAWSSYTSFSTLALYDTLTNAYVQQADYNRLYLVWSCANRGAVNPVTGYRVSVRPVGETAWTEHEVANTGNTYTYYWLTGLDEATAYEYMVEMLSGDVVVATRTGYGITDGCSMPFNSTQLQSGGLNFIDYNYKYTYSQTIVTTDEMEGMGNTVSGVTFYRDIASDTNTTPYAPRYVDIYMGQCEQSYFDYGGNPIPVDQLTLVASQAELDLNNMEVHVVFDSPFVRSADSNLVIALYDSTGFMGEKWYMRNNNNDHTTYYYNNNELTPSTTEDYWPDVTTLGMVMKFDLDECTLPDYCEQPTLSANSNNSGYTFEVSPARNDFLWNYRYRMTYDGMNWEYVEGEWIDVVLADNTGSLEFDASDMYGSNQYQMQVWRVCNGDTISASYYFNGRAMTPYLYYTFYNGQVNLHIDSYQQGVNYTISYRDNYYSNDYVVLAENVTTDTFLVDMMLPSDRYYNFRVSRTVNNGATTLSNTTGTYGPFTVPNPWTSYSGDHQGRIMLSWYYQDGAEYTISYRSSYEEEYTFLATMSDTGLYLVDFDLPNEQYYYFQVVLNHPDTTVVHSTGCYGNCGVTSLNYNYSGSDRTIYWPTVPGVVYTVAYRLAGTEDEYMVMDDNLVGDGNTMYYLVSGLPGSNYYNVRVSRDCGGDIQGRTMSFYGGCGAVNVWLEESSPAGLTIAWDTVYGDTYVVSMYDNNNDTWVDVVTDLVDNHYTFTNLNSDRSYGIRVGRQCAYGISYSGENWYNGTCQAPTLYVSGVTTNSVEVAWEAEDDVQYTIGWYSNDGSTSTIQPEMGATSYVITGLEPATVYDIYIERMCYSGAVTYSVSATTKCEALPVPYSVSFGGYTGAFNTMCWTSGMKTSPDGTTTGYEISPIISRWTNTDISESMLFMRHGGYVIMPEFNEPLSELQVSFVYNSYSPEGYLLLGVTDNNDSIDHFMLLDTIRHSDYGADNDVRVTYRFDENFDNNYKYIVFMSPIDTANIQLVAIRSVVVEEIPPCLEVSGLSVTAITDSTADIQWEASSQTNIVEYVIEYGYRGFTLGEGNKVYSNTNSIHLTNLEQGTDYQVYVYVNCGRKGLSYASSGLTFTTDCAPVSFLSEYLASINTAGSNGSLLHVLPNCWTYDSVNTSQYAMYEPQVYVHASGDPVVLMYDKSYVAMPELSRSINELMIEMQISYLGENCGVVLGTVSSNAPGFGSSFQPIDTIYTTGVYTRYLDDVNTTDHFLALKNISANPDDTISQIQISYVVINEMPACLVPQDVHVVEVTSNSVTIDWTDHLPASEWRIEYYDTYNYNWRTVTVTSHPVTLENLRPNTQHYVTVGVVCEEDDEENVYWANQIRFITNNSCFPPVDPYVVAGTGDSLTIDWTDANGDADEYEVFVEYVDAYNGYTNTSYWYFNTHPITIDLPYPGTTYNISIRSRCASTGSWTATTSSLQYTAPCTPINVTVEENFYEYFGDYGYGDNRLPFCWNIEGEGQYSLNMTGYNTFGMGWNQNGEVGDMVLYAPEMVFEDTAVVSFDYKVYYESYEEMPNMVKFQVGYVAADGSTVYLPDTVSVYSTSWQIYSQKIPDPQATRIVIHYIDNVVDQYQAMLIRNFEVSVPLRPDCYTPAYVTVDSIASEYAALTVMDNNGSPMAAQIRVYNVSNYQVVFSGNTDTNGTIAITGLSPMVMYSVGGRAHCGEGFSQWNNIGSFTTACDVISELPYYVQFLYSNEFEVPSCWSYDPLQFAGDSTYTMQTGVRYGYYNSADATIMAMPAVAADLSEVELSFYAYSNDGSGESGMLVVGVVDSVEPGFSASFVPVDTIVYNEWDDYHVYFFNYTGTGRHIAFKNISGELGMGDIVLNSAPECIAPANLHVVDATTTTVTVDWDNTRPTDYWLIEYNGIYDTAYTKPYTVEGLQPGTNYNIYIHTICPDGGLNGGNGVSAVTECGDITALPYNVNFGNYDYNELPNCWTLDTTGDAAAVVQYGEFYIMGNTTVATPKLDVDLSNAMVVFNAYFYNVNDMQHKMQIGLVDSVNPGFTTSFEPLYTIYTDSMTSNTIRVYLDNVEAQGKYIALRMITPEGGDGVFYTNNFAVREVPACAPISDLHVVTTTDTSITLDWVARGTATSWEIECSGNGSWRYFTTEEHPYTITGLTNSTTYTFYVVPICNDGYANQTSINASTDCGVATELPLTYNFESYNYNNSSYSGEMPNCWYYDNSALAAGQTPAQMVYWNWDYKRLLLGHNDLVATPVFQSNVSHFTMSFYLYYTYYNQSLDTINLVIGTTAADGSDFVALDTVQYDGITYGNYYELPLVADFSNGRRFAVKAIADSTFLIDNINIYRAPACEVPVQLTVVDADVMSVTLDWSSTDAEAWQVEVMSPDGAYRLVDATEHPFTVGSLHPGSEYAFRVRAVCGEDDYTDFTEYVVTTTLCDVVTTLPITYTFNDDYAGGLPSCWTYDATETTLDSANYRATEPSLFWYSSVQGNVLTIDYTSTLALPEMTVPINTLTVEYDVIEVGGSDPTATIMVGIVSGNEPGFAESFVSFDELHYTDAEVLGHHVATFTGDFPAGSRVAIKTNTPTTDWHYIVIDNVEVSTSMAPCTSPEITLASVGINEAVVSWEASNNEDTWELLVENENTYDVITVTESPYTITGLDRGTWYTVSLRSLCGADHSVRGPWSEVPISFQTLYCQPNTPTGLTVSNITAKSAVLSWTSPEGDNAWVVQYVYTAIDEGIMEVYGLSQEELDNGEYSGGTVAYENPFTLDGLFYNSTVKVRVAHLCDPEMYVYGDWTEWVEFNTLAADCQTFNNFALDAVSDVSATISWTDGYTDRNVAVVPAGMSLVEAFNNDSDVFTSYDLDSTTVVVTGLSPLTDYYFYVWAYCDDTELPVISEPFAFTTTGVCYSPSNLQASATANSIDVSWTTQAESTEVAISTEAFTAATTGVTVTATQHTFADLMPNTTYYVGVRSLCETSWHTLAVTTDTVAAGDTTVVCKVPSNLVATAATASTITVGWSTEAGTTQIGIAPTASWPAAAVTSMTSADSYTFQDLQPETQYTIGVRSLCDTTWLTVSTTTTACPTVTDVVVDAITETSASIDWTDVAIGTYRIEYGTAGFVLGQGTVVNATVKPYTLSNLTANTAYDVYVLRQCVGDVWEASEAVQFTTLEHCYTPENIALDSTTTTSISFHWSTQASATLVAYVAGSSIAADAASEMVYTTNYTINGLMPNTLYTVALRSECETVWHTMAVRTDTVADTAIFVCPSPTNLAATATAHTITATWNATAAITLVAIAEGNSIGATAQTSQTSATSYIFSGLEAGTQYTVGVRAECDDDWLTFTLFTNEEQDTSETCPLYSNLSATVSATSLTATWTTTADTSLVGICQGAIWNNATAMATVVGTAKTFTGLAPNTQYTVGVRSLCNDTLLTYTVTTLDTVADVCNVPQNVGVTGVTATTATVSWTAINGAAGYEVRLVHGNNVSTATTTQATYTFDSLSAEQNYAVSVRTVCDAASQSYSDWSNEVTFTTLTGIDDVAASVTIDLYPNPASTEANITVLGINGRVQVAVVDMNGRTVSTFEAEADRTVKVDVSQLAHGAYFVRVLGTDVNVVRKLIVR